MSKEKTPMKMMNYLSIYPQIILIFVVFKIH